MYERVFRTYMSALSMFSLNSDVMLYLNAKRLPETLQRLLNLMIRASFRGKEDLLFDRFYD
jgi:hypothetical protein